VGKSTCSSPSGHRPYRQEKRRLWRQIHPHRNSLQLDSMCLYLLDARAQAKYNTPKKCENCFHHLPPPLYGLDTLLLATFEPLATVRHEQRKDFTQQVCRFPFVTSNCIILHLKSCQVILPPLFILSNVLQSFRLLVSERYHKSGAPPKVFCTNEHLLYTVVYVQRLGDCRRKN